MSEITQRPMSKCEMRNKVYFKPLLSHSGNIQTIQSQQQIYKQQKSDEGLFKGIVVFKSQTVKALNNTMVTQQESRKFNHACDLQLIFANKGKGSSRSFQQTFVGEECVTSQKNVCVGGYRCCGSSGIAKDFY